MVLNKEAIFAAEDSDTITLDVPEWGGSIRLRPMTGQQRAEWEYWATKRADKNGDSDFRGIRERLIISCVVDDDGKPLFDAGDLDELAQKNAMVLDRISDKCQEISGMKTDSVEDAAKN